jgi:hypothetical protein
VSFWQEPLFPPGRDGSFSLLPVQVVKDVYNQAGYAIIGCPGPCRESQWHTNCTSVVSIKIQESDFFFRFISGGVMQVIKMKYSFGNLMPQLLLLAVIGFFCGPSAGQSVTVPMDDLSGVKAELQRHGWRVEQSPEGDLLLWAPSAAGDSGRQPVRLKQAAIPEGEQIPATDIDLLLRISTCYSGSSVRPAGWFSATRVARYWCVGRTTPEPKLRKRRTLAVMGGWMS